MKMALKRLSFTARNQPTSRTASLTFETLERRQMLAADLYITEFAASNDSILDDGDGNSSDWIEVFNPGSEAVDLGDYYLTDDDSDLTKWNFPSISLGAGQFIVIFASGQPTDDYVDAGGNFHTNFRLSAGGRVPSGNF